MYRAAMGALSRQRALTVLAALALVAGVGLIVLGQATKRAAADRQTAVDRLREVQTLALHYDELLAGEMKVSADPLEARSNEMLIAALDNAGLAAPADQRQISYDDLEDTGDGRQKLRINIDCRAVALSGVIGFLNEIDSGRKNLVLLSAEVSREKPAVDSWDAHFVYGALIAPQAKSRS